MQCWCAAEDFWVFKVRCQFANWGLVCRKLKKRLRATELSQSVSLTFVLFLQVYSELEAIIDKLAKDVQKGTLPKRMLPKPLPLPSTNNSAIHSNSMSNL
jgi:hypothetical protein